MRLRRGRPKLNRPAIDLGTPELRAKRERAVGPKRQGWPEPNVADGEHALGILLWRGELAPTYEMSKRMYDAGIMFAGWWMLCNPKSHPGNTLRGLLPGSVSEGDTDEARANLTTASRVLGKERAVLDAVINCVVYQRVMPRKLAHLRTGLCRLMQWRDEQRRAA